MKTFLLVLLCLSILLNIGLFAYIIYNGLYGCEEIKNGKIGVLTRDVSVGPFDENKTLFTLPKGLVVKDVSATGFGRLESERFKVIVTSNDDTLVNYDSPTDKTLTQSHEVYSVKPSPQK